MLTHIEINAGSSAGKSGLRFELTPVIVFVGPNNSGKSRALIEIESIIKTPLPTEGLVIKKIDFESWERTEFESELEKISIEPQIGEVANACNILIEKLRLQDNTSARFQINRENLISEAINPNEQPRFNYSSYLSLFTLRLDGRSRLSLTDEKQTGDLVCPPTNHLAKLFKDDKARKELRRIVHEAFGKYLVIDPTHVGYLRLRLSSRAPEDDREEQGWDDRSRNFHSEAKNISEFSDGVKAFVGMLTTLIAGDPYVTLIDEPEAFLHPTLSSKLGMGNYNRFKWN